MGAGTEAIRQACLLSVGQDSNMAPGGHAVSSLVDTSAILAQAQGACAVGSDPQASPDGHFREDNTVAQMGTEASSFCTGFQRSLQDGERGVVGEIAQYFSTRSR